MLKVFFTTDVEIWCGGWKNLDKNFSDNFNTYVYGRTGQGDFGLPFQLKMLTDCGIKGVFFVESLFAARFGVGPLQEIVDLIQRAGHEVQLHVHAEWVDEVKAPLVEGLRRKRQHLNQYNRAEQTKLIATGRELLLRAGVERINCFRAGSFALNVDTLAALRACGIGMDSSYNAAQFGLDSGVSQGKPLFGPCRVDGVEEYPMTVFRGITGQLRHAQLTACSAAELESLLWRSIELGRKSVVLLSHNFELLTPAKDRPDWVVIKRFAKLCDFLARHRSLFDTSGFNGLADSVFAEDSKPVFVPPWKTGQRILEQISRMRFGSGVLRLTE